MFVNFTWRNSVGTEKKNWWVVQNMWRENPCQMRKFPETEKCLNILRFFSFARGNSLNWPPDQSITCVDTSNFSLEVEHKKKKKTILCSRSKPLITEI